MKADIEKLLGPHGLAMLGTLENGCQVLVGNAGSAMWQKFKTTEEFLDGGPDSLDRWTRRIGLAIAASLNAEIRFPFDGPPYPPFQTWSQKTGRAFASPISLLIHTDYGLWHAYRFSLHLDTALKEEGPGGWSGSPCLDCPGQPCLSACPVDAFSEGEYRVHDCVDFLNDHEDSSCRELGCAARAACPVAPVYRYEPEHAQFHMKAFLKSRYLS